jgi:hypothetical protein
MEAEVCPPPVVADIALSGESSRTSDEHCARVRGMALGHEKFRCRQP